MATGQERTTGRSARAVTTRESSSLSSTRTRISKGHPNLRVLLLHETALISTLPKFNPLRTTTSSYTEMPPITLPSCLHVLLLRRARFEGSKGYHYKTNTASKEEYSKGSNAKDQNLHQNSLSWPPHFPK